MSGFVLLSLVITQTIVCRGVVSESCKQSSYLPEGLACKLDIFIRSEGANDTNRTLASGSSFLIVNGKDYSRKSRGFNVAVFDQITGLHMTGGVFDVSASASEGTKLKKFLENLPSDVIILMAIQSTGNANSYLSAANAILTQLGVNNTAIADKQSLAAILCKGPGQNCKIKQSKNSVGNGPSFVSLTIQTKYAYVPEASLREPYYNAAAGASGGKCNSSSSNSNDCGKAIDSSSSAEWVSNNEGIGAWLTITFPFSKINKIRIFQRTLTAAQIKDIRIDFSDCTTFHLTLTKDKNGFEEFTFSPRIASWIKLTVTSTYSSTSAVGFKEIELFFDKYDSEATCHYASVSSGAVSAAYSLLTTKMSLRIKSKDAVIILSTTSSATGPRYEVRFDQSSTNTTTIKKSEDGSTIKELAKSITEDPVISETTWGSVWVDWTGGRIIVGMVDRITLYYRDETPLIPKFLFAKTTTTNGDFEICGRPDDLYIQYDIHLEWPFDKEILYKDVEYDIQAVANFSGSDPNSDDLERSGTIHGSVSTQAVQGNCNGFSNLGLSFGGTSDWLDLGDFTGHCISDPDLCRDGLTVLLRVNRQGSGERFIISTNGENGRGFAISHFGTTGIVRFELRDSETRWRIDIPDVGSGLKKLGLIWSSLDGLQAVVMDASGGTVVRNDFEGEDMESPDDTSSHVIIGKTSNGNSKFFQGTIDSLEIYAERKFRDWTKNSLKDCELSVEHQLDGSCYELSTLDPSLYIYPGLDPSSMSPNECKRACGKENSIQATITEGDMCTCINSTDPWVSKDSTKCDSPCTGNIQRNCGGTGYALVAVASTSALSLVCNVPSKQEALTKSEINIQTSLQFYGNYLYRINIGYGFANEKYSSPFQNMFIATENFTSTPEVEFKNNETGETLIFQCPNSVSSYLPTKNVSIRCPSYVPVNQAFKCNITYDLAGDGSVVVNWLPGTSASFSLPGSRIVSWGPQNEGRSLTASGSGMYIIPERLNVHGRLIGFVVHATKEGYFEIKCLSVQCNQTYRFCPSQKMCIAENTECQQDKITCNSGKTLRMESGECATPGSSPTLPSQSAANFDYKIKSTLAVWTNAGKRMLVPMNKSVDMSCDYIGLYFPEDKAAVVKMNNCSQCTLYFPPNIVKAANASDNVLVGLRSPQPANGPTVKNEYPNFKLMILLKGSQFVETKYNTDGLKPVKLTSSSGATVDIEVCAQHVLSNISISRTICAYPTKRESNVSLAAHDATNATYTWIFPDRNITTSTPWTMYSCTKSGMNSATVLATNKVSLSYTICEIECQDDIDGLDFALNGLQTTAVNETTRINFLLKNGSHVTITIDPGDGSGLRTLNNSKVSGAILVASLNKTYTAKDVYKVNITACNKLGVVCQNCKSIQGDLTIQEKIANLTLTARKCIATNSSGNFTSTIKRGGSVKYSWTTDGNQTFKTDYQSWFSYSYGKSGKYNMSLIATNNVSTAMMICNSIQVKDVITGVEVGPVLPSGIPQKATIPFKIDGGTDIQVSICFGDGVCMDKNGTVSADGPDVYNGSFTHNYTKSGDYVANVTFCNCVGCNSTLVNVHIEIPVEGPKMVVSRHTRPAISGDVCRKPLYVKVKELVYVVVGITNGTNVKVLWEYGDGSNSTEYIGGVFHQSGVHSNHSYSKAGNYTIKVRLHNQNGHLDFSCRIVAQDPCLGLVLTSNSPQGIPDGSMTTTATTKDARPSDPMECVTEFGDGQKTGPSTMTWSYPHQSLAILHNYQHKGSYVVTANCSNAISFCVGSTTMELQDKISGSKVEAYGKAKQGKRSWVVSKGYNGFGKRAEYFPMESEVQFQATSFNGSNLTCCYCFDCNGPEQKIINASCGNITHKFTRPGIKKVKVTTKNDVSIQDFTFNVTIDESIQCAVKDSGPKIQDSPHVITITPTKRGPYWCCLLKYGYAGVPDLFVPRKGDCNKPDGVEQVNTITPKGDVFTVSRTFPGVGEFKNVLQCWSRVAECQAELKSVVVNVPCKQPIVTIPDLFPCNSSYHPKLMRSVQKVIRTKNIMDCEASLTRSFKWEFYRLDSVSNSETKLNLTSVSTDSEFVTLPPRLLQIGMHKVCFILNMTNISGIFGEACCSLEITQSPVFTAIKGGSEVAVGWNKTKTLDASDSHDPDTPYTAKQPNVKCYWFCKCQYDTNYTLPNNIDVNNLPAVPKRSVNDTRNNTNPSGCFGDGPGRLGSTECKRDISTGNMQENTTCQFKVFACAHNGRCTPAEQSLQIKMGDPPEMDIKCSSNCKAKLNPSDKTSLSCSCSDCSANMRVVYEWKIREKTSGSEDWVLMTDQQLTKYVVTPLDGRNLVVKANSLKGGNEYKFVCDGWRWKKGGNGNGQSVYKKMANLKPINGHCDVRPKTGVALNTSYTVTCSGWEDADKPLTYTYGIVPACDKYDQMQILAADRMENTRKIDSLPSGSKENNYTKYLVVYVSDSLKAASNPVCIPVQVKVKAIELKQLENMLSGQVNQLVQSGNTNEANAALSAMASQLNTQSSTAADTGSNSGAGQGGGEGGGSDATPAPTKSPEEIKKETEEKKKIRASMVDAMSQIKPATLADAAQTAQTLGAVVNCDAKELSPKAQEKAANILQNMAEVMKEKAKGADSGSLEVAVTSVLSTLGRIMGAVAQTDAPVFDTPTFSTTEGKKNEEEGKQGEPPTMSSEKKAQNRKLAKNTEATFDAVTNLILESKIAGETPTVIKTPDMTTQLARNRPKDLVNKTITVGGFSIKAPDKLGGDDFGGGVEPAPIDSKCTTTPNNVYNYHSSAALTKGGNVNNMEYLNSSGNAPIVIKDLETLIEMHLTRAKSNIKPEKRTMDSSKIYSHKIEIQRNDSTIHINVYPDSCDYGFEVFIRKDGFPTDHIYDKKFYLPRKWDDERDDWDDRCDKQDNEKKSSGDGSALQNENKKDDGCEEAWSSIDLSSNCTINSNASRAFEIFISNRYFNHSAAGVYYIGIKRKARNGTKLGDHLATNYTLVLYTTSCLYWDKKYEIWTSDGCEVGPKTTPKVTQCLCNHLTSFSSSCIVPPNKIDWDKITNFDISEAYVCLTTVLAVIGIYFLCVIPARRADRRDAEKTGVTPLPDNDPRDNYCYEIHVHTGFVRGAGTSAEVSIVMNGSVGDSDPRVLKDPARKTFRTGGVDAFLMTAPQSLGVLRNIRIWHNNGDADPSWNLLRLMIQDLQTEQRWWFVCDEWLAVDEGDGKIERILYPATSNELTKFNVLFATEIRKNLTDGHLWFSVVTRPAHSTFTRVQRLTCCLSILLTSMLANMMFYKTPSEKAQPSEGPKGSIQIAGFSFSLQQVSIGVISSLVVFPANLIIVQIFRKARAQEVKTTVRKYDEITLEEETDLEMDTEAKPAKKEGLPHWCVYIAYAVAFISSAVAGVFVIFYGATFGVDKSAQWLMSMTVSLIQDVLISQPIKIFLLASIFALLIKDPNKAESNPLTDANKLSADEEWLHKNVKDLNDEEKKDFKKLMSDRPPDEAKLEIARQLRKKEKQMKSIIREIVWYMIFLLVILTISYGNRDPDTYRITKYMNDLFVKAQYSGNRTFDKVSRIEEYWEWMNKTVIPSVYKHTWYNNREKYPLGFLADTPTDYILAVVRLRQLRIQKDSCPYLPIFKHVISECNDFYTKEEEDHRSFLPGWVVPPTINTTVRPPKAEKTAWEYQTGIELKTFPYWGHKATYDAGGFAKELPTNSQFNKAKAHTTVEALRSMKWIDRYTRAIFTELAIYNANSNFFCVITLLYEQLPTGGLFNYPSILTLKLYRYVGGDMYFVMACEIMYLVFTLYFIFRELKKVKNEGIAALNNVWSVTEVFVTMLSLSLVVLYFLRIKFTGDAVSQMRAEPSQFVSFNYTAFLDEWINALMGLIVFLSFLKIIRLLRFNRRMSLLAQTLKVCIPRIFAFLFIYGIAFFAYSQFACLVFGPSMQGFGTVLRSATTLMDTILGKFALKEMTDANRILGPLFFYIYTLTMVFILINMFLSIINDSFAEVNSDINKQSNDYEIVDFMVHRLKENIGKTMGNAIVPIYKEPKTKLENDFDAIQENADNIMHYMRNLTYENIRHTRWFDADVSKKKKKKMFEILMEVDWDYFEDELGDSIPVFEDFMAKYDEDKLHKVHESYRYKKIRDQEMESKMSSNESESEEMTDDSDDSNSDDLNNNDSNDGEEIDNDLLEVPPQYDKVSNQETLSPGHSIRSMYGLSKPPSRAGKSVLSSPRQTPTALSPSNTPSLQRRSNNKPSPAPPLVTETEMSQILDDVERQRCATDAELDSFLPGITLVDDNNIPKYESDPEQTTAKPKKKKKSKHKKSRKSSIESEPVSIQSKSAWGEADGMSRTSPAGLSEKDRMIPDGEESKVDEVQDNEGFEADAPSNKKPRDKKKKKKKKRHSEA